MSISWADVTALAPELSTVDAGKQTLILDQVNNIEIHDDTWRSAAKANLARRYLAAHLASVTSNGRGSVGPVQSESVGQVSRSYAISVAQGSSNLDTTSYGKEYRRLVRNQFGGPWVV